MCHVPSIPVLKLLRRQKGGMVNFKVDIHYNILKFENNCSNEQKNIARVQLKPPFLQPDHVATQIDDNILPLKQTPILLVRLAITFACQCHSFSAERNELR